MTVMIIGGTGFLGSHLARHLIRHKGESNVVAFDSQPLDPLISDIREYVTVVRGDILEPTELFAAMQRYDVDRVVHLAAILGGAATANPSRAIKVNCVGTTNVFEVALLQGVKRVVYASSAGVYPGRKNLSEDEVTEDILPVPDTIYGACKLFNEHEANIYWRQYGLDVIGLRPTGVFGLGRVIRGIGHTFNDGPGLAALGQSIVMPPDDQLVDSMYVVDAAEAWCCALSVENPIHRIFNMRSDRVYAGAITDHLRSLLPNAQIDVSEQPLSAPKLMNNQRLCEELNFKPRYSLKSGLEEHLRGVRPDEGLG